MAESVLEGGGKYKYKNARKLLHQIRSLVWLTRKCVQSKTGEWKKVASMPPSPGYHALKITGNTEIHA